MVRQRPDERPDIVLILVDDMGFSDLGCYGGEIDTPHLDTLAADGVTMSQFYNTARCSPARASLLTGLHPHQTGIGVLTDDDGAGGYPGTLNDRCVTAAELLGASGYRTAMVGKWHLTGQFDRPNDAWPTRRGFQSFYGTLAGAADYFRPKTLTRNETPIPLETLPEDFYLTTAFGREAARVIEDHHAASSDPFLLYLALTAPHWPLQAPDEVVRKYRGRFDAGWDELRRERYRRQLRSGLLHDHWQLSERDPGVPPWQQTPHREWQARRMEAYAAQVELMDGAVGRVVDALRATGRLDNTLIIFLSDNGGCAEELPPDWADELPGPGRPYLNGRTRDGRRIRHGNEPATMPGSAATFASYGQGWANLSNTPFREYKHWVHEGGIATPLIAHWPDGNLDAGVRHGPFQLPDVLATLVDITGAPYPEGRYTTFQGHDRDVLPAEGVSMLDHWRGLDDAVEHDHPLYFEHEGNCAIREGDWKLVRKHGQDWELYQLAEDRTELNDLASQHPERVEAMARRYQAWADRCGVLPREQVIRAAQQRRARGERRPVETGAAVPRRALSQENRS